MLESRATLQMKEQRVGGCRINTVWGLDGANVAGVGWGSQPHLVHTVYSPVAEQAWDGEASFLGLVWW